MRENSQNFRGNPDKKVDCFVAKDDNAPRNDGFTLAETLITLVIIGIIAAITVPSLINKTNNHETVSRLKKAYSILSQATNQIIAEEGPATNWATSQNNIFNLYKKKLITAKECNKTTGCFTQGTYKFLSGRTDNLNSSGKVTLVLQDGMQILFSSYVDSTCSLDNKDNDGSREYCSRIFIDVNGAKKPNAYGRDYFGFVIKKGGLYPAGCDYDTCSKSYLGEGCTCKVIREEAINY